MPAKGFLDDMGSWFDDIGSWVSDLFGSGGGDEVANMLNQFPAEWGWTPTTTDGSGNWNFNDIGSYLGNIPGLGGGDSGGGSSGGGSSGSGSSGAKPTGSPLGSMQSLLPILAMIGGGINQNVNTREATDAMLSANRDAQNLIQGQLDRNATRFTPWTGAGADAVAQLAAMPPSNLAGRYKPLGSGRGISLASLAGGR